MVGLNYQPGRNRFVFHFLIWKLSYMKVALASKRQKLRIELESSFSYQEWSLTSEMVLWIVNKNWKLMRMKVNKSETCQIVSNPLVIILLIIIHPNFSQTNWIANKNVDTSFPFIWTSTSKYVTNMGTRDYLQDSTTHPSLFMIMIEEANQNGMKRR